ncbi:MAG: hypothetical protein HFI90_05275 [Clostridia bacterium]|nr:hypothetical protein [Clostridia bacterium]
MRLKRGGRVTGLMLSIAMLVTLISFPAAADSENLAGGVTAQVAFHDSAGKALESAATTIRKMTDGNEASVFDSPLGTDGGWYLFDLYTLSWVNRLRIKELNSTIQSYYIEVSTDGKKWSRVFTGTLIGAYGKTLNFPATKARYIRLTVTKTDNEYQDAVVSIAEFGVYSANELDKTDLKNSIYLAEQKLGLMRNEKMKHHYSAEVEQQFKEALEKGQQILNQSMDQTTVDGARDMLDTLVTDYMASLTPMPEDFQNISNFWRENFVGNEKPYDDERKKSIANLEATVDEYLATIIRNPKTELWSEFIPIRSNEAMESSKINETLTKFRFMATAYEQEHNKYYKDAELLKTILDGVDFILTNKYYPGITQYGNWWYWTVSTPTELTQIMMILGEDAPEELCKRCEDGINTHLDENFHITVQGTNRLYFATISLKMAAMVKNPLYIHKTVYSIAQETRSNDTVPQGVPTDGFYWDGSFMYHSGILYNASYGRDKISNTMSYVTQLSGTPWQMEQYIMDDLAQKMTDGFEGIMYDGYVVDNTAGRSVGSGAGQGMMISSSIGSLGDQMSEPYRSRFKGIYKETLMQQGDLENELVKDESVIARGPITWLKRYPVGDKVVLQRPEYGVGLSMFSDRTKTFEAPNGDAMQAWYASSGMTYYLTKDKSQFNSDYWVAVDHYRLPGITVDMVPRTLTRFEGEMYNSNSWVSSMDYNEEYGVAGMEVCNWNSSLTGRKSWFLFDDEIVCLGSGITGGSSEVESIVDNRMLKEGASNRLVVNGEEISETEFEKKDQTVKTIYLEGNTENADMGYYFPGEQKVTYQKEHRSEKKADMWLSDSLETVDADFCKIRYEHGINPKNAGYSYVVLPNTTQERLKKYEAEPDIEILAQDDKVHAVRDNKLGVTGYNFWSSQGGEAGGIRTNGKLILMNAENEHQAEFSMTEPTMKGGTVTVTCDFDAAKVLEAGDAVEILSMAPLSFKVNMNNTEGKKIKLTVAKTKPEYSDAQLSDALVMKADADTYMISNVVKETGNLPKAVKKDGRLYLPLKTVAKAMGSRLSYGESQKTWQLLDDRTTWIGEDGTVTINGEKQQTKDAAVFTGEDGTFYVTPELLELHYKTSVVVSGDVAVLRPAGRLPEDAIEKIARYIGWE